MNEEYYNSDEVIEDFDKLVIVDESEIFGITQEVDSISYKCPKCNTVFVGIPTNNCMFCNHKFDIKSEDTEPKKFSKEDLDYKLW
jgi:hypothetical protein